MDDLGGKTHYFRKHPCLSESFLHLLGVGHHQQNRSITGAELRGVRVGWRTNRKRIGQKTWLPKKYGNVGGIHKIGIFLDDGFKRCVGFLPVYSGILGLDNPNLNLRIFFQTKGSLNHPTYFPSVDLGG